MKVEIAAPCHEKWEAMERLPGNERQRHCAACKLNVYDTRQLTEAELEALLTKTEGRVCGRVFKRADGTVLTRDCPRGLALVRKRALAAVTMAVTLLLAVVGFALLRSKGRSCSTTDDEDETWFDRVVTTRAVEAREELRDTKSLGPVINALYPLPKPLPVTMTVMGKMAAPPKTALTPTPTPTPTATP